MTTPDTPGAPPAKITDLPMEKVALAIGMRELALIQAAQKVDQLTAEINRLQKELDGEP